MDPRLCRGGFDHASDVPVTSSICSDLGIFNGIVPNFLSFTINSSDSGAGVQVDVRQRRALTAKLLLFFESTLEKSRQVQGRPETRTVPLRGSVSWSHLPEKC